MHALWGLRAAGVVVNRPQGGWPATVVRGVWCQALSLPQPPVLWGRQPGFRDPCVPVQLVRAWGPSISPTACALAGRRCALWGWRKGRPQEGYLSPLRGAFEVRRSAFPGCLPSGRAVGVHYTRALGAVVRVWGPGTVPLACMPYGGCVPGGVVGGRPSGGWPATVVRGVWCQALSLPRPPVFWGGRPGFHDQCVPDAVGVGVRTQHRPHSVRPCGPAWRAVGVAGGRPRGRCLSPL